MFPVICQIGPFTVYSYGLMFALAVMICAFFASRDAKSYNLPAEFFYDFAFWVILGGIIGARIFYIILNFSFFVENPQEIIMLQKGGLAWQGGLTLGAIAGIWLVRKRNLSLATIADVTAPYIALGEGIGRIGCFLNGCCYGKEVSWGLYFPVHDAHLHPTQLYTTFGLVLVFVFLKRVNQTKTYPGQAFVWYLILAPLVRFIVEFFRDDHENLWLNLSIFQYVCIGILLAAWYAHTYFTRRARS